MLTSPRYEGRRLPPEIGTLPMFGVFDTMTQTFVVGDQYDSLTRAISAAGRMSAAYDRTLEP